MASKYARRKVSKRGKKKSKKGSVRNARFRNAAARAGIIQGGWNKMVIVAPVQDVTKDGHLVKPVFFFGENAGLHPDINTMPWQRYAGPTKTMTDWTKLPLTPPRLVCTKEMSWTGMAWKVPYEVRHVDNLLPVSLVTGQICQRVMHDPIHGHDWNPQKGVLLKNIKLTFQAGYRPQPAGAADATPAAAEYGEVHYLRMIILEVSIKPDSTAVLNEAQLAKLDSDVYPAANYNPWYDAAGALMADPCNLLNRSYESCPLGTKHLTNHPPARMSDAAVDLLKYQRGEDFATNLGIPTSMVRTKVIWDKVMHGKSSIVDRFEQKAFRVNIPVNHRYKPLKNYFVPPVTGSNPTLANSTKQLYERLLIDKVYMFMYVSNVPGAVVSQGEYSYVKSGWFIENPQLTSSFI